MNNFTVELVTSDNTTRQSCGDYIKPEPVSRGGSYTFNCNYKQGRYVYVRRLRGYREQQLITLCEVNVGGYLTTTTITTTTSTATTTTPQSSTMTDTPKTEASPVTAMSTDRITRSSSSGNLSLLYTLCHCKYRTDMCIDVNVCAGGGVERAV